MGFGVFWWFWGGGRLVRFSGQVWSACWCVSGFFFGFFRVLEVFFWGGVLRWV